jgi:hypothetical protein
MISREAKPGNADQVKAGPKAYHKPVLTRYGSLRETTRGQFAYSFQEAVYQSPEQMS